MRDAVLYLTGYRERNIYGQSYAVKQNITMDDLMVRTRYVIQQQSTSCRANSPTTGWRRLSARALSSIATP